MASRGPPATTRDRSHHATGGMATVRLALRRLSARQRWAEARSQWAALNLQSTSPSRAVLAAALLLSPQRPVHPVPRTKPARSPDRVTRVVRSESVGQAADLQDIRDRAPSAGLRQSC